MNTCLRRLLSLACAVLAVGLLASTARAACCYFSAKDQDILQPAQKAFITWDPEKKLESFTVQPKFEGNALDFGMVIPTPSQPRLHEMPRDFFKHLAVFSILKRPVVPKSKLVPLGALNGAGLKKGAPDEELFPDPRGVTVLESGVVGSLDYKVISAERADDLYKWLKDNKYSYSGDEATLNHYVQKKWVFTVMKIDTMQMKKKADGTYDGEVTPTRFQFTSERLVYPLKITQISVKDKTEALFYVQAPYKVNLPGDMSYQYTWLPMLQSAMGYHNSPPRGPKQLQWQMPRHTLDFLEAVRDQIPDILRRGQDLGFAFQPRKRPVPNADGRTPTTMEWAKLLTDADIQLLAGKVPYSDTLPDLDEGFAKVNRKKDKEKFAEVLKVIQERFAKCLQERPNGYLVREAPAEDVKALQQLAGHLQAGLFITKFRKIFTRAEMGDDLIIVPAREGNTEDRSGYEVMLPVSPP